MKWFNHPTNLEELKSQYKKLAMQNHPDRGGNVEVMKEINREYDELFEKLRNIHQTADGKTYTTQEETHETPNEFREIIERLITLEEIQIELCGSWLWITGNTLLHKDVLKELRFRWSQSKRAWYYHSDGYRKHTGRSYTLDEIRDLHGSETIKSKPQLKLAIV